MDELAIFEFVSIPIYLKFLCAPFLDEIFSQRLGRRMTFILPLSFILSIQYYYLY